MLGGGIIMSLPVRNAISLFLEDAHKAGISSNIGHKSCYVVSLGQTLRTAEEPWIFLYVYYFSIIGPMLGGGIIMSLPVRNAISLSLS
jgi:hypothetical protein